MSVLEYLRAGVALALAHIVSIVHLFMLELYSTTDMKRKIWREGVGV